MYNKRGIGIAARDPWLRGLPLLSLPRSLRVMKQAPKFYLKNISRLFETSAK